MRGAESKRGRRKVVDPIEVAVGWWRCY